MLMMTPTMFFNLSHLIQGLAVVGPILQMGKMKLEGSNYPQMHRQQKTELPLYIQAHLSPKASAFWTPPNCFSDSQRKYSLNLKKTVSSPCYGPRPGSPRALGQGDTDIPIRQGWQPTASWLRPCQACGSGGCTSFRTKSPSLCSF